jgi:hypothetical protein
MKTVNIEPRTFRLLSTPLCFTPGIIAWTRHMTPSKAYKLYRAGYPGVTQDACANLYRGRYTLEGDVVVVIG